MSVHTADIKRITTHVIQDMKNRGEKITCLTAYDYSRAGIVDAAGVELIRVGDSASNVMAGHETTLPITIDQMIYHASSVVRAVDRALIVVDMPFGSYQGNSKEALSNAIRIMNCFFLIDGFFRRSKRGDRLGSQGMRVSQGHS